MYIVHVTANNEAIQAKQQLPQDLYPDQQSSQETLLPTEPARPRPRT